VPVTTFNNDVTEGRVELDHRWSEAASGTLGFQGLDRDFSALGDEAFVPVTQQRGHGLFAIERLDLGPVLLEAGARIERQRARPQPQETVFGTTITLPDRDFIAHSYSASATWRVAERAELAIAYQRAQRPPDVQELYSLGPHLATRTFDVGNPQLAVETLSGVDLGGYGDFGWGTARANVYRYSGKDFIYQENTGIFYDLEEELFRARCVTLDECLPVVRYDQRGARLYGYEAELMFRLGEVASGAAELTLFGDLVRGRFKEGDDIPRLPPPRYGAQLAWFGERLAMRVRVTRGEPQNRPGANETPTAGYVLLNASAQYTLGAQGMEWVFYLVGRNLLDREIRNSTSFLRNLAPEPGRSIEVGVQARF
jgi:iron complex outermembrane receptor protein